MINFDSYESNLIAFNREATGNLPERINELTGAELISVMEEEDDSDAKFLLYDSYEDFIEQAS